MVGQELLSEYDVVIVGAGPAGCSAANFLKKDFRVLMIDYVSFPRNKPCGGLLTDESKEFIKRFELPDNIYTHPKYLDLTYIDFDNNLQAEKKKKYLNIDRSAFDYALLNISKKNVDFLPHTKLLDVVVSGNGKSRYKLLIENSNNNFVVESNVIIGADGALSTIRSKVLANRKFTQYLALQEWSRAPHSIDSFTFIFCKEITDYYSWLIPKGDYLVCGAALPLSTDIDKKFQLLKQKLNEKLGLNIDVSKKEAHLLIKPKSTDEIVLGKGNILLAGEAAGLISPSTGDGISFALRSGFNCAQAINRDINDPYNEYSKRCNSLVSEIQKKLEKANTLSDKIKRSEFLNKKNI